MQGTIQRVIRGKGFGFILAESRQFFFHHTEVRGIEFKQLAPGDLVEFEATNDAEGRNPRATELTVVQKRERPSPGNSRRRGPRSRHASRGRGSPAEGPERPSRGAQRSAGRIGPRLDVEDEEFVVEFAEGSEAGRRHTGQPRGRACPRRSRARGGTSRPRASGPPGERGEGVIRAIDLERGFGFIRTAGGDLFFHKSGVKAPFESLCVGSRVAFVFGAGDKGSTAQEVSAVW